MAKNVKIEIQKCQLLKSDSFFKDVAQALKPFAVEVLLDMRRLYKTSTQFFEGNLSGEKFLTCEWNEEFTYFLSTGIAKQLELHIINDDAHYGTATIPFEFAEGVNKSVYDIFSTKKGVKLGNIQISVTIEETRDMTYDPPEADEIQFEPPTTFPTRKNCRVTLYQDAHNGEDAPCSYYVEPGTSPLYKPGNLWEEICSSLLQAKHFIFLTGWSLNTATRLIRRPSSVSAPNLKKPITELTIGELLKMKAEEGVSVRVILWDDMTSSSVGDEVTSDGLLNVRDEESRIYFQGSKVKVLLSTRAYAASDEKETKLTGQGLGVVTVAHEFIWSHHQKTIMVDVAAPKDDKRVPIAYIGGLDIASGRWDTPRHSVFVSLENEHKDDFYQESYPTPGPGCPRQPWHDVHAKVEGEIVQDILHNFNQRWKQDKKAIVLPKIMQGNEPELNLSGDDSWEVQMLRSFDEIDTGLVFNSSKRIERDIQLAYIQSIRSAKRFLYIESQYFIGSSPHWLLDRAVPEAKNLIPLEIVNRIIKAIVQNQMFTVYIVIPLWPEGDPTGPVRQQILWFQWNTIHMMYQLLGAALRNHKVDRHPTDYLNFYSIAKRETLPEIPLSQKLINKNLYFDILSKTRRHPIYVHSKMMIVDDEYIIIGSANINERSMAGNRDSEISIGARQPRHTSIDPQENPRGVIHGFRMSLWAEHLNCSERIFLYPQNLDCVHRVNQLAEENWRVYASARCTQEMRAYLVRYPLFVHANGDIHPDPYCFPDTVARVHGESSPLIPSNITI